MIWTKYSIKTTTKDSGMVSAILLDFGIADIEIEDNVQLTDEELNRMYADFVKELPEDDGTCSVNFYLDENSRIPGEPLGTGDSPTVLPGTFVDIARLKEELSGAVETFGIEPVEIISEEVEAKDWENGWKEYFKPFEVDGIIIKPTWEDVPEGSEGKAVINIDPGMAFGTGMHETTRLCLKGLKKYMKKGDRVLDLGCGSGILGIAALKIGADFVNAVDIDEQAVKIAYENFELNMSEEPETNGADSAGFGECPRNGTEQTGFRECLRNGTDSAENAGFSQNKASFQLNAGNVLGDSKFRERISATKYDIVLANILAEVIAPLTKDVGNFMNPGAYFISSGILKEKEDLIAGAVRENPDLEFVEAVSDGDWVSVVARRK